MNPSALPARRWPALFFWLTLLLAAAGVLVVLLATSRYGIGLTPDSVAYIAAARGLNAGRGLLAHDGAPLVKYGPLYPAVLAVVGRIAGADPLRVTPWVHALLFGLLIFDAGRLGRVCRPDWPALPLFLSLATLVALPFFDIAVTAWSELLFLQLCLGAFLSACAYLKRPDWPALVLLTLCSAGACLTRYVGVTLVLMGTLAILLGRGGKPLARLGRAGGYVVLSLLPLGAWALRNHRLTGTFFGERAAAFQNPLSHLTALFKTVSAWYGLPSATLVEQIASAGLLLLGAACLAALVWRSMPALGQRHAALGLPGVFAGLYTLALLISQMGIALTPIGHRYMSPVYLPLALWTLVVMRWLYRRPSAGWPRRALRMALSVWGAVWLAANGGLLILNVMTCARDGAGYYHSVAWSENGAIQYLRAGGLGDRRLIYTNVPGGVYILTDGLQVESAKDLLAKVRAVRRSWCKDRPALEPAPLALFDAHLIGHEDEFSMNSLRNIASVEEAAAFQDSAIYWITPQVGPCR